MRNKNQLSPPSASQPSVTTPVEEFLHNSLINKKDEIIKAMKQTRENILELKKMLLKQEGALITLETLINDLASLTKGDDQ
ncbi:MAG: hypothetical protein FWG98_06715 [Candidatus Cloacimonetes bacterium]|nr:hypothetical protein [Candidatus Cloacimonadota bacterium]